MQSLKGDEYLKKIISALLCLILVVSLMPVARAEGSCRAVIGADLTEDQVNAVYTAFGVPRGAVPQLTMTNMIERYYLDGYVDSAIIGTHSISCVYLELLPAGSGMDVVTSNISWVTPEMYISALASAGITDARIVVASPVEVSGTAALAGIYWAYEDLTGIKIDDTDKLISTQQLTITGDLAKTIGSMDATSLVDDLKEMLDYTHDYMSDEEIRQEIIQIAAQYNVSLTDKQISQLISLCRSLEGLDTNALLSRVQEVQGTLNKVSEAKTRVVGFVQTVRRVVTSVQSFFDRIKDIIGL
jgi:Predicted secreted protein